MRIHFFDDNECLALWPIASTRSVSEIRLGHFSIAEKWMHALSNAGFEESIFLNSRYLPSDCLIEHLFAMPSDSMLMDGKIKVAQKGNGTSSTPLECTPKVITKLSDLFLMIGECISLDVSLISDKMLSAEKLDGVTVLGRGKHPLFIAEGAKAEGAILNLNDGPIILGLHAEVMEGAMVRGPFVLGAHAQVKMGAKIYGPTSIGPHCKVGGELSNVLFLGYANKAHDGFLGNSVIGEWCNLGADTNCSNLKNNYGKVKQWNYACRHFENTGLQFCGLVMGDHAKAGINTMFNTGTVVGVGANVFGGGFPPSFIPDFSWGGAGGLTEFQFEKFLETATAVMQRRGMTLNAAATAQLKQIFDETRSLRNATI